jgi:hypothetical protein
MISMANEPKVILDGLIFPVPGLFADLISKRSESIEVVQVDIPGAGLP